MLKLDDAACDLDATSPCDPPTELARAISRLSEESECAEWGSVAGRWGVELLALGIDEATRRLTEGWGHVAETRRCVADVILARVAAGGGWVVWWCPPGLAWGDPWAGLWYVTEAELVCILSHPSLLR